MPAPPSSPIDPAIGHLVKLTADVAEDCPGLLGGCWPGWLIRGIADWVAASTRITSGDYEPRLPSARHLGNPQVRRQRIRRAAAMATFAPCLLGCTGTVRQNAAPDGTRSRTVAAYLRR